MSALVCFMGTGGVVAILIIVDAARPTRRGGN